MYFKSTLSREKIRALERLPRWQWDLRSGKWETSFVALQRWLDEHDNTYPCYESQVQNEKLLATWVRNQRMVYYRLQSKSDVCTTLNEDRRCRLEQLPDWDWRHQPWEAVFEELQTWLRRHSPNYPKRKSPNTQEDRLAVWIHSQRTAYHNDCLSEKRTELLNTLAMWTWHAYDRRTCFFWDATAQRRCGADINLKPATNGMWYCKRHRKIVNE